MEVDLRSSSTTALATLDGDFRKAIDDAVAEENARTSSSRGVITVRLERVGDRLAGHTPDTAPIVRTALSAAQALGLTVPLTESSTDSSVAMARGTPSIAIGAGGRGSGQHTPSETFDTTDAWRGLQFAILLVVALAR